MMYEDIYINGFYFAADVDHGCRQTHDDPGEPASLLAVYIQGDDGWIELDAWHPEVERAISLFVFDRERYETEFNRPSTQTDPAGGGKP
jgi:hypothetical protein